MKKETIGFLIFKYGIYVILGGLLLMRVCGYSIEEFIHSYKAKNEMETIHYGGSVSEVNKYIEMRNKKVEELNYLISEKAKQLNSILYYTNDTTKINSAKIRANREYRSQYVNPSQIGRNYIAESEETLRYINEFQKKEDSLGYNIFIDRGKGNEFLANIFEKKLSSTIHLKNINKKDSKNKYKVIQLYYYSDKAKQRLTEQIENRKATWFVAVGTTPEKEMALLDEIQFSTTVFTEEELQNQKLNHNGLKSLFAPSVNLSKESTFYFICYNKKMDKLTFSKKAELFKTMFLKKQPTLEGKIKSVKVNFD